MPLTDERVTELRAEFAEHKKKKRTQSTRTGMSISSGVSEPCRPTRVFS